VAQGVKGTGKPASERMREMRLRRRQEREVLEADAREIVRQAESIETQWREAFETGQAALRFREAVEAGDAETLQRIRVWLQSGRRELLWLATEWLSAQGSGEDWRSFLSRST
jgi:hypothetical protein